MSTIRIIVNADDLGINAESNVAIEEAIKKGCISSSTIMANAPAFDDAIRIAKQYPQVSFGIHLNVDEFAPLTNADVFGKYGAVDDAGMFRKEALHNMTEIGDDLVNSIYAEWKAQLEKVIAAGVFPSHVDSHEHTHGLVVFQDTLISLLKEYNIKKVRIKPYTTILEMIVNRGVKQGGATMNRNMVVSNSIQNHRNESFIGRRIIQLKKRRIRREWVRKMRVEGFKTTGFFDSYQMFYHAYPKLLKFGCYKTVELMTHPGHPGYQIETDLLMQKKLKDVCQYELINYNDL